MNEDLFAAFRLTSGKIWLWFSELDAAGELGLRRLVQENDDMFGPISGSFLNMGSMPIDSLIILSRLREERRLTTSDLAPSVQKPEATVRATLEILVETGFLEPHGTGRGRTYTLSAKLYRHAGQRAEYIRQAGFAPIQQEQMVLSYIEKHGSIKRGDVMDLCHLDRNQAYRLLAKMKQAGKIKQMGEQKGAVYEFP